MAMEHQHTVIVVCGPTAVGKTAFALALATHLGTEIISADSRQCFKELNIGVAKPTVEELAAVPHHFIDSYSVTQDVNAAVFEQYALTKLAELFKKHPTVVMVGGTGLYIKAFCEGLDEIPEVDPLLRQKIIDDYAIFGLGWLQDAVQNADPDFWQTAEQQNPQRLMRALEVIQTTGKSINSFRKGSATQRPFNIIKIGLELPRPQLNQRIHQRVDEMVQNGLVAEVESVLPFRHLNALQTVGYKELFDYFDGIVTLETAIENIKTHTRQYAKRQMTWFKRYSAVQWFNPNEITVADLLRSCMKNVV
jgi:tRNA dimethylallyltransferase